MLLAAAMLLSAALINIATRFHCLMYCSSPAFFHPFLHPSPCCCLCLPQEEAEEGRRSGGGMADEDEEATESEGEGGSGRQRSGRPRRASVASLVPQLDFPPHQLPEGFRQAWLVLGSK